jgi:hypothetical protein
VTLKTPQTLVAVLAVLALVIAGVGMFAVILPQRSQVGTLNQQLAAAEATLVAAHAPPTSHPAVGQGATDLFRLMEAMPNNDEMPGILLDLSALAKASSVTITSVRPSPRIPLLAGYSAIPIVVDVNGTYAAVTKLLHLMRGDVQDTKGRLAVDGRLLITNEIQLTSPDGRTVQAILNLDAFDYGALPSATATAGAPAGAGSTTTAATTSTASTSTASTTTPSTTTTAAGSAG